MKKIFLSIAILFSTFVFAQVDVKNNYTKPYFQGNVRVADTLGIDSLIRFSDGSTMWTAPFNIYNSNGVLTGNRIVDFSTNRLEFDQGGGGIFRLSENPTGPPATKEIDFYVNTTGAFIEALGGVTPGGTPLTIIGGTQPGFVGITLETPSNTLDFTDGTNILRHNASGVIGSQTATWRDKSGTVAFLSDISDSINSVPTFYTNDGTLTGNRTVSMGANNVSFNAFGGVGKVEIAQTLNAGDINLYDATGQKDIYLNGGASSHSFFRNSLAVGQDIGIGKTLDVLGETDLKVVPGSLSPLRLFEGTVGVPAAAGANYGLFFDFTDSNGDRFNAGAGSIVARINGAPQVGTANPVDLYLGSLVKITSNHRVLIQPNGLTQAALAQLQIEGDATLSPGVSLRIENQFATASGTIAQFFNDNLDNLFTQNAVGLTTFNDAGLSTADFRIETGLNPNAFFIDAGTNFIGILSSSPIAGEQVRISAGLTRFGGAANNTQIGNNGVFIDAFGSTNTNNFTVENNSDGRYFSVTSSGGEGRVAIGNTTSVSSDAILSLNDTNKAFLNVRLDTAHRNAISTPVVGMEAYNTTTNLPTYYNGSQWIDQLRVPLIKSGTADSASFIGTPKKDTITFTTAFPDTLYSPVVTCETKNGTTFTAVVETITASGFTINMGTNDITDLISVRWVAIRNEEN